MISLIVASSENNVIGKDNELIWKLSNDLKRFKELTTHNTVIMGRKTYESIGMPLPKRLNIIVTRNKELVINKTIVCDSIENAISKSPINKETFVIGGSQIYNQSLKYVNKIYLTKVHGEFDGDSHFMSEEDIISLGFKEIERHRFDSDEKNECDYSFITYER